MSQGGGNLAAVASSLGPPPRRHRGDAQQDPSTGVGTSMSARFGETEWEAREVSRIEMQGHSKNNGNPYWRLRIRSLCGETKPGGQPFRDIAERADF